MQGPTEGEKQASIRLVTVDDHPVIRAGVRAALNGSALEVVAEAADGHAALAICRQHCPSIVLLDMYLPHLNGTAVIEQLSRELPTVNAVVLSKCRDPWVVREAMAVGARGYLFKGVPPQRLQQALLRVAAGHIYLDPVLGEPYPTTAKRSAKPITSARLSRRELDVLRLLARGASAKEAAGALEISPRTLETYKARAMQKLQLRSRVDLMRFASHSGWL